MVMGLALCSTLAFAQTANRLNLGYEKVNRTQVTGQKVNVDYKASIFTKESDTLYRFKFDSACVANMIYGSAGAVLPTDVIDGQAVGTDAMGQSGNNAIYWQRIPDSAYMYEQDFQQLYPRLSGGNQQGILEINAYYYSKEVNMGEDNGFMVMSMYDATQGAGNINAYMQFPAIERPEDVSVIDINFTQLYYQWNSDHCYIDYYDYTNNGWKSREINVRGVDIVGSNPWGDIYPSFTMPLEIATYDSIKIRVRWACGPTANYYGIFWSVDNLCIVAGDATRMTNFGQTFVDGAYGTMPLNMPIPLSWYSKVANNGSQDLNNVNISVRYMYDPADTTNEAQIVHTVAQGNFAAGDPTKPYFVKINERHFLDSLGGVNVYGNADGDKGVGTWGFNNYYGTYNVPANYFNLPVDQTGESRFQTFVTADNVDTINWAAYSYNVVDEFGGGSNLPVTGYRWAHDNGVIPSGSAFHTGFELGDNTLLVSDSGNYGSTGYWVAVRYTTGSVVPENWALLGIEIVPSTSTLDLGTTAGTEANLSLSSMHNAEISPIVLKASFDNEDDGFLNALDNVATGFSNSHSYVVNANTSTNLIDGTGYIAPDFDGENYQAVNIALPNMPLLEPNTSYYIGYRIDAPSRFSAAKTATSYTTLNAQNQTQRTSYSNTQAIARYARQFGMAGFDIFVHDPGANMTSYTLGGSGLVDGFPMIRAIVGERADIPDVHVIARCNPQGLDSTLFVITDDNQHIICDNPDGITIAQGSSTSVLIIPNDTMHYYIDSIVIDGTAYSPYRPETWPDNILIEGHNYHVMNPADTNQVALFRDWFEVSIEEITDDVVIDAIAHWEPWHIGIDPVAPNVTLGIQPNPATSQVKINVAGVSGMVNCSIIDMSGRVVYNRTINAEEAHMVDLSNFTRGAYFVRVTNDTFSKVEKLIVR